MPALLIRMFSPHPDLMYSSAQALTDSNDANSNTIPWMSASLNCSLKLATVAFAFALLLLVIVTLAPTFKRHLAVSYPENGTGLPKLSTCRNSKQITYTRASTRDQNPQVFCMACEIPCDFFSRCLVVVISDGLRIGILRKFVSFLFRRHLALRGSADFLFYARRDR